MLLLIVASVTVLTTAFIAVYLRRVPDARGCPRCGGATESAAVAQADGMSLMRAAMVGRIDRCAERRRCSGCDWQGRMRGPAPESIEIHRRPRRGA